MQNNNNNKMANLDDFQRKKRHFRQHRVHSALIFAGTLILLTQNEEIRVQFHQHSTPSFYVRKLRMQLLCAYLLGLYFTGVSLLAQKLHVECWWNCAKLSVSPTFYAQLFVCEFCSKLFCAYIFGLNFFGTRIHIGANALIKYWWN